MFDNVCAFLFSTMLRASLCDPAVDVSDLSPAGPAYQLHEDSAHVMLATLQAVPSVTISSVTGVKPLRARSDSTSDTASAKMVPFVAVIVPTYNEKENIEPLVTQLLGLRIEVRVIVVDDNSPDGTGGIADGLAVEHEGRVGVIHREGKLGLGTAYVAGFKRALSDGADLICTMDADFSHNPRYVPDLVERISQGYDLVIGSRYVDGGGTSECTIIRKLLSWGANAFARGMLGLHARDATAGFRCYRREVLESVGIDEIKANGYSFLIEMLFRVQRQGWRVGETPILFENRRQGVSKISQEEIAKAIWTVLRLRLRGWRVLETS